MKKLIYTIIATVSGIQVLAQIQVADTSVYDTVFHINPSIGVQQLYGIQRNIETKSETGHIAVYVANAEEEHIIGAKVQIMEGEHQVAFGITDCYGTLCFSRIQTGNYDVKVRHIAAGEQVFHVQVKPNTETELRVVMESTTMMCLLPLTLEYPIVEREPIPEKGCKTKSPMKGGLKVAITNAERDDIIGAVVQVMDGERHVAGGVTDFTGLLYLPNIAAGTYEVMISHGSTGKKSFEVTITSNQNMELVVQLINTASLADIFYVSHPVVTSRSICSDRIDSISSKVQASRIKSENGIQRMGGLRVSITNAEKDDIIGAKVQVMNGERQIAGGVTDFAGFLYLPNVEAGTYTIVISHISVGKTQYLVRIPENEVFRLKVELRGITCCCYTVVEEPIIQDPFVTSYTSDQVLRTP